EFLAAAYRVQDRLGTVQVEGKLSGMDLTGERQATLATSVKDRRPGPGEVIQSSGHDLGRGPRRAGHEGPQSRPGKPTPDRRAELLGRPDGGNHFFQRALAHAGGLAIAPDVIGQQRTMAVVDGVADRAADAVVGKDGHAQVMLSEQIELVLAVVVLAEGALHL